MYCKFQNFILIINIILICLSSIESQKQNNNKNYIKKIFNSMNSYQRIFSFLEQDENDSSKASAWLTDKVFELLRREVGPFIQNRAKNISESCKKTLFHYLIYDVNNNTDNNISLYHIRKFFEGASKHKNDLSTYDICMYNNFRIKNESNKNEFADSVYLIMTLDKSNLKKPNGTEYIYTKSNADVESIFYVRAFCFPQEKINGDEDSCSDLDYYNFLMQVNEDLNDIMDLREASNTTYFILKKENFSPGELFLRMIPLIVIIIQIILILLRHIIILLFKKNISKHTKDNYKKLVNDIDEDEKNKKDLDLSDIDNLTKEKKKKEIILATYPKWVKNYNKSYNLTENFKELFNFSLNSTEINNDSGLTYIRGLKSFSLIFLVLGLTFFTFINSFSKTYSKFLMNEFLNYFLFPLFFIGLRYSPRIIFSCSGYTLSFKYVSYIQKDSSISGGFKFIFYQLHKYLMLFLFFLFERYSLYKLSNLGEITRPMWKYFEKNILSQPDGGKFLISFLDLTTIYTRQGDKRIDQTLIDYFWLPFNEIFFFIIGVIILSIGYKFKLRIDFALLILILLNLIGKVVFSYIKKTIEGEAYYATLYYYLFDYGKFMLHPLFNLPYYLIGMYFGLINYSVQKGLTSLYVSNSPQEKAMINLQNMFTGENEVIDTKEEKVEEKQIREEIRNLPFLISGVNIITWLKGNGTRLLGIIISLILLFFCFSHLIFYSSIIKKQYDIFYENLRKIDDSGEDVDNVAIDKEYQKMEDLLLLGDYITNGFINFLYRIDIELFVFFIQALLFILYFKGQNFINDFFCHIFWGMLNKPYFSLILVANPLILFIFYQSETRIILNFYNVLLYSIISGCIIFLFGSFAYLFFELPFKRLIHNIFYLEDQEDITDDEDLNSDKTKDE